MALTSYSPDILLHTSLTSCCTFFEWSTSCLVLCVLTKPDTHAIHIHFQLCAKVSWCMHLSTQFIHVMSLIYAINHDWGLNQGIPRLPVESSFAANLPLLQVSSLTWWRFLLKSCTSFFTDLMEISIEKSFQSANNNNNGDDNEDDNGDDKHCVICSWLSKWSPTWWRFLLKRTSACWLSSSRFCPLPSSVPSSSKFQSADYPLPVSVFFIEFFVEKNSGSLSIIF